MDFDPYTLATWGIESGGNPNAVTGSNRGLSQFGHPEERQYGIDDSNRHLPEAQASALSRERAHHAPILRSALGRDPTDAEHYIMHQQGIAGGPALLGADPSTPAWQAIRKFYPNDAIAQRAITGNIPRDHALAGQPAGMITAGDFTNMWRNRFDRELQRVGGGSAPMQAAFQRSQGPMAQAASDGDVTGSTQGARAQMGAPMEDAMNPGMLGKIMSGVEAFDPKDTLGNMGAWLIAGSNPAGGAALLAANKKNTKDNGEWSHQIDPNTGQVLSVNNKTGAVRTIPIPGYNTNKAVDEDKAKKAAEADVALDTQLGEEGRALGARRENFNQAKALIDKFHSGVDQGDTAIKLKQFANQYIPGSNFADVPDAQVVRAVANKMVLDAQNVGGKRALAGSMSDADLKFMREAAINPTNTREANQRILEIADKQLQREESASAIHRQMSNAGAFTRSGFNNAIAGLDAQRAAAAAQAAPAAAPPPAAGRKPLSDIFK